MTDSGRAPGTTALSQGVQYPKGKDKADLAARMKRAFSKVRVTTQKGSDNA